MDWAELIETFWEATSPLPFLFAAFLLVEWIEKKGQDKFAQALQRTGKAGPVLGAALGCIPQCGFSAASANLYAVGLVTPGTLLAVFIATSDEAFLILMARPEGIPWVGRLILCKIIIGVAAGYLADGWNRLHPLGKPKRLEQLCEKVHEEEKGIFRAAFEHTVKIYGFLLVLMLGLEILMELGGEDMVHRIASGTGLWQPFLTAAVGLIPSCLPSVVLAELFLDGAISFGAVTAGLVSGAGMGVAVLFRANPDRRENVRLASILYGTGVLSGLALQLLGI